MSTTSTPDSRLGGTGIQTGRIGLGCVTFGREIDHDAAFAIMDYAVENGITLFDTAESYGDGASDRIVGRWLCSRAMRRTSGESGPVGSAGSAASAATSTGGGGGGATATGSG